MQTGILTGLHSIDDLKIKAGNLASDIKRYQI